MANFDSIKIGVCDCFWSNYDAEGIIGAEIFLGLTKGGCELTYTPEWFDITVDQFGKTPTESVLVGEKVKVKVPLAETDLDKLELFSHTAKKITSGQKEKITFGRRPGFRLAHLAGKLRMHPVAMGDDISEDVTIYKAVNTAPLNLVYKLDAERIYSTEFGGIVDRQSTMDELAGTAKPFLWEIGDPTT